MSGRNINVWIENEVYLVENVKSFYDVQLYMLKKYGYVVKKMLVDKMAVPLNKIFGPDEGDIVCIRDNYEYENYKENSYRCNSCKKELKTDFYICSHNNNCRKKYKKQKEENRKKRTNDEADKNNNLTFYDSKKIQEGMEMATVDVKCRTYVSENLNLQEIGIRGSDQSFELPSKITFVKDKNEVDSKFIPISVSSIHENAMDIDDSLFIPQVGKPVSQSYPPSSDIESEKKEAQLDETLETVTDIQKEKDSNTSPTPKNIFRVYHDLEWERKLRPPEFKNCFRNNQCKFCDKFVLTKRKMRAHYLTCVLKDLYNDPRREEVTTAKTRTWRWECGVCIQRFPIYKKKHRCKPRRMTKTLCLYCDRYFVKIWSHRKICRVKKIFDIHKEAIDLVYEKAKRMFKMRLPKLMKYINSQKNENLKFTRKIRIPLKIQANAKIEHEICHPHPRTFLNTSIYEFYKKFENNSDFDKTFENFNKNTANLKKKSPVPKELIYVRQPTKPNRNEIEASKGLVPLEYYYAKCVLRLPKYQKMISDLSNRFTFKEDSQAIFNKFAAEYGIVKGLDGKVRWLNQKDPIIDEDKTISDNESVKEIGTELTITSDLMHSSMCEHKTEVSYNNIITNCSDNKNLNDPLKKSIKDRLMKWTLDDEYDKNVEDICSFYPKVADRKNLSIFKDTINPEDFDDKFENEIYSNKMKQYNLLFEEKIEKSEAEHKEDKNDNPLEESFHDSFDDSFNLSFNNSFTHLNIFKID